MDKNYQFHRGKIEVVADSKKEIKFWLEALSNHNLDEESVTLINKCLHCELKKHLNPLVSYS